jgi:hypothetical protein
VGLASLPQQARRENKAATPLTHQGKDAAREAARRPALDCVPPLLGADDAH